MFVITTDGKENASINYGSAKIKEMIKQKEDQYGWEFLFLASNIDAVETAEGLGIRKERAVNYDKTEETAEMFLELNNTVKEYRLCGIMPKDCGMQFENNVKKLKTSNK